MKTVKNISPYRDSFVLGGGYPQAHTNPNEQSFNSQLFGEGKSGSRQKNSSGKKKVRHSLKMKINQPYTRPVSGNRLPLYSADGDHNEVILDHD